MSEDEHDKLLGQALNGTISWEEYSRRMDYDIQFGLGDGRPLGLVQQDPVTAQALKLMADELEQTPNGKTHMRRMGEYLIRRAAQA